MSIRKLLLALGALVVFSGSAFAGYEDWEGSYTVMSAGGKTYPALHTPAKIVLFNMINSKEEFKFSGNIRLNDLSPSASGRLARVMDVDTFTSELAKWGVIVDKVINLGPTYPV